MTRIPALKYAIHAIRFSWRLSRPFTNSACWCVPNRPPLLQKSPIGTCHVEIGIGLISVVTSNIVALAMMPVLQLLVSSVTRKNVLGSAGPMA